MIGSQHLGQHPPIKAITFRWTHPEAIPSPIQRFRIHRIHHHPMIQQELHHPPLGSLNGRPQLEPRRAPRIHTPSPLPQTLRRVGHQVLPHNGARLLSHTDPMLLIAPIHSDVIPWHPSLLSWTLPRSANGSLALYRSSVGQLPIERLTPFLNWVGQSSYEPHQGSGRNGPRPSKLPVSGTMNKEKNPNTKTPEYYIRPGGPAALLDLPTP